MTITIEIKYNYGVCAFYPMCDISRAFARIAGTKTLTKDALNVIKTMGYTITQQTKEIAL
jgi:hypothetical protein